MAPCEAEMMASGSQKWIKIGKLNPLDRPGSFSNIREDEIRETVVFECSEDDSETRIFRSGLEVEWEKEGRKIPDLELLELVITLKKGESYEMNITTDRGKKAVVRFSHR